MLLLAQMNLALPAPWNWIGLAVSGTIFLGILGAIWGIYAKLGLRPPHKLFPLPKSSKYPALPKPKSTLAEQADRRLLESKEQQEGAKLLTSTVAKEEEE
jgi:hypothetical protein